VEFRAGHWVLEDTSTNGVFINGSDVPASVEGTYSLKDGDRLRLGDYEILVSIDERQDFPPDASGQMPSAAAPARPSRRGSPAPVEDLGEDLDLTDLLSDATVRPGANEPARTPQMTSTFDLSKALGIDLQPPRPSPPNSLTNTAPGRPQRSGFQSLLDPSDAGAGAPGRKNEDWQMQTQPYDRKSLQALTNNPASIARALEKPAPTPAAQPQPQPQPVERRREGSTLEPANGVEAFCRGAGIDPSALPIEAQHALLQLAGQMTREVVLGLMETLKGRSDQKSRLRLSQTTIQPTENNPLKFSASVDEALLKLLDGHSSRYLGPVEAIRDSFADLRNHQIALSTAIQAAIDEVMNRIEPGELQEKFDRGLKRGALLGAANKMKYWDLYTEFYHVLNQRNEQNLPTLFAEELARTYAEKASQKKR
jgi:type VI secretion system protein